MMWLKRFISLCLCCLLIVGVSLPPAVAAAEGGGWYVNAGAGASLADVPLAFWSDTSISDASIDTVGPGYQVGVGYQLRPHFALEIDYLRAADTDFEATSDGALTIWLPGRVHGTTAIDGFAVSGVGFWNRGSKARLQLYGKGGVYLWDTLTDYSDTINAIHRFNDDGLTLIGGAGGQFRLGAGWELRAEALYTMVRLAHRQSVGVGFATLGVIYRLQ